MAGGGSRRDDDLVKIGSTNVFAALEALRKKKKSDKEFSKSKAPSKAGGEAAKDHDQQAFWAPAQLSGRSWADVDDDDDDYYATTAPPQPNWSQNDKETAPAVAEESESEDFLDEEEEDVEEPDYEPEVPASTEVTTEKPSMVPLTIKDTERQLSKKELKKKEMAELDAVLKELGISGQSNSGASDKPNGKKLEEQIGEAMTEGKFSRKKKSKKEKSSKEIKEDQEQGKDQEQGNDQELGAEPEEGSDAVVGVKEKIKKVASLKKKKSSKEIDAAARAAAMEAAARNARLAAAKKKEKSHYNQQPVR